MPTSSSTKGKASGGAAKTAPKEAAKQRAPAKAKSDGAKATASKAAPKGAAAKAGGGKAGGTRENALQKPLTPSPELAAVVGKDPLPRTEVVSKVWDYIKSHKLQNPENRREILADETLGKVFGKPKVTMFEMNKHLAQHLS